MTFARPTIILLASIVLYEVGEASIAAEAAPSGLYEMRTETGMPNLEDNLLYAVVTERRCLNPRELSGAFWMMSDVSLQDCTLVKTEQTDDASTYALKCEGGHGTSGHARWQLGPDAIVGPLDVRLGGKNMTFFQRITARPVGRCR